jgi:hypothetical protein
METARDVMEAIENGSVVIDRIVRETIEGPHVWGRNAFEYSSLSRGFTKVKNNMLLYLRDMTIAEKRIGTNSLISLYRNCFYVGTSRMSVPNTNNPKWWYVVFFSYKK